MNDGHDDPAGKKTDRRRPKGYYDWRPRKKTVQLLAQVHQVLNEYEEYLPLTVRQIFYRLVGNYGYEKTDAAYKKLAEKLTLARRAGFIPFEAIRDDGIVLLANRWHDGVEGFWDEVGQQAKRYERDRQLGQKFRLELWAESAGMLPQLDRIASRYSIPVYSAGGQPSVTANWDISGRIVDQDVPTVILHVGDYDPSGESIFRSMTEDIAAFVEADRIIQTIRLEPVRVALTAEQVADYNLPTAPVKSRDSRSKKWQEQGKGGSCLLEALATEVLSVLVLAYFV